MLRQLLIIISLFTVVLLTTHHAQAAPLFNYGYEYDYVTQSPGNFTRINGDVYFEIVLKNTGTQTWYRNQASGCSVHLGTGDNSFGGGEVYGGQDHQSPFYAPGYSGWLEGLDSNNVAYNGRRVVMQESSVAPNSKATFRFLTKQAAIYGYIKEYWTPVVEGSGCSTAHWLNGRGMYFYINNFPYRAALSSQNPSGSFTMQAGETKSMSVQFRNAGPLAWPQSNTKLATVDPYSNAEDYASPFVHTTWSSSNRIVALTSGVAVNDYGTFNFTIQAPSAGGTYKFRVRPLVEGQQWMNDEGMDVSWTITVQGAPTNQPPNIPSPNQPVDNVKVTAGRAVNFSWSGSDPNNDTLRYSILVATDPNFSSSSIVAGDGYQFDKVDLYETSYNTWIPTQAGVYYWRVIAFDGQLNSNDWSFRRKIIVRNPLVFIPGVMGSHLRNTERELWPPTGTGFQWVVDHHNGLRYPGNLFPNLWANDIIRSDKGDVYSEMLNTIRQNGYAEYQVNGTATRRTYPGCDLNDKGNFFVFAYDWRLNIGDIALSNTSPSFDTGQSLQNYVACINRLYPGAKVDILAHSMGGLVASMFALAQPNKVDKLITMGTPYLGSPNALYTMATGDIRQDGAEQIKDIIKGLVKNVPGVHQLLPSKAYFDFYASDNEHPLREAGYDMSGDGNSNSSDIFSYSQYKNVLNHADNFPDSITNNEFFHTQSQDNWSNQTITFKYYPIIGLRKDSQGKAKRETIGQVKWERECMNVGGKEFNCGPKIGVEWTVGDDTVPYYSAARSVKEGGLNYNPPNTPICEVDKGHGVIQQKSGLLQNYVFKILDSEQPTCPGDTWQRSRTRWVFAPMYELQVYGVDEIFIIDQNGLKTGLDKATQTYIYENTELQFLALGDDNFGVYLPTDQTFTLNLRAKEGKTVSLKLTQDDGSTVIAANRYNDLSLPANTLLQLQLTPQGLQPLQQDSNGDQMVDSVVPPTANVVGTLAADTDSPTVTLTLGNVSNSQLPVTIIADDGSGSGVKKVYYSTDGRNFNTYSQIVMVDSTQVLTVYAFADDNVGNRSELFTIEIPQYKLGDITGDGSINIFDLQKQINLIMHTPKPDTAFAPLEQWQRADLRPAPSGDGQWNVFDLQALINLIMGRARMLDSKSSELTTTVTISNAAHSLTLNLRNQVAVASGEIWLDTHGMAITQTQLTSRTPNFEVVSEYQDGQLHILFYNLQGITIAPGDGSVLQWLGEVSLTETPVITKVLLADHNGNALPVSWVNGQPTSRIFLPLIVK